MDRKASHLYEFGAFRLDADERLLLRNGETVALPPKAFDLLLTMVGQPGHLLEKEELLKTVWPDHFVEENNLADNVFKLRKALGEGENGHKYIETVPKRGYRFVAPVTEVVSDSSTTNGQKLVNDVHAVFAPALPDAPSTAAVLPSVSLWQSLRSLWVPQQKRLLIVLPALLILVALWFWRNPRQLGPVPREMKITTLSSNSGFQSASLSPDGNFMVSVESDDQTQRLSLRQVTGGQPLAIGPPLPLDVSVVGTTFSPDRQFVYYTTLSPREPQGVLYRVPVLGGPAAQVLSGIVSPVSFAPDGQRMAFLRNQPDETHAPKEGNHTSLLMTADRHGGNERMVLFSGGFEKLGMMPAWSPDGREIACARLTGPTATNALAWMVVGVEVQSGATRLLTPQRWDGVGRIAWLSDGSGFVMAATKQGEGGLARDVLWLVSQPEGTVRRLSPDTNYSAYVLSLSQDGQTLLAVANKWNSQIWAAPLSTKAGPPRYEARDAVQLTHGTHEGRAGLISVDKGGIVYGVRSGEVYALWQMRDDGSQSQQLTTDPPFLEELTAPADGNFFVFASNRAGRSHLFRVERDGSNLRQLTDGAGYEIASDCSPDGRWIVYGSLPPAADKIENPQLWKIPAEGGTPVRLTDYHAGNPHISPDGQWISFVSYDVSARRWELGVIPATGGPPVKRFASPAAEMNIDIGGPWTPDGQALSYLVIQKRVGNIWAQPLDGGAPYPLTNFTSGVIYRYAFDRDGKRLYLARGYPTNDAVLIRNFR